jgi:DNA topoisomerase-1
VIVESLTKARTIAGYLGRATVESSTGNIRDMPDKAAEIPAVPGRAVGRLGVNGMPTSSRCTWSADKKQQVAKPVAAQERRRTAAGH